jgi:hypothetical protein
VVHAGLEALIARERARRLAALGGSDRVRPARRRRTRLPDSDPAAMLVDTSVWVDHFRHRNPRR